MAIPLDKHVTGENKNQQSAENTTPKYDQQFNKGSLPGNWQQITTAITDLSEEEIKCPIFFYSHLRLYLKHGRFINIFTGFFRVFLVTGRLFIPLFSITFSQHQIVMFPIMKSIFLRTLLYATVAWRISISRVFCFYRCRMYTKWVL